MKALCLKPRHDLAQKKNTTKTLPLRRRPRPPRLERDEVPDVVHERVEPAPRLRVVLVTNIPDGLVDADQIKRHGVRHEDRAVAVGPLGHGLSGFAEDGLPKVEVLLLRELAELSIIFGGDLLLHEREAAGAGALELLADRVELRPVRRISRRCGREG